jgi:hypothetical protein
MIFGKRAGRVKWGDEKQRFFGDGDVDKDQCGNDLPLVASVTASADHDKNP